MKPLTITLEQFPETTDKQVETSITFHAGEIAQMRVQLSNPNEKNKDIIRNSIIYHLDELSKLGRVLK